MAYTTIDNPALHFNTVLYTGNATARTITTGLTNTDLIWIKRRDSTSNHRLTDVIRGATKMLSSNNVNATQTSAQAVTALGTDTFSLGTDSGGYDVNANSQTYVSWNWSANGTGSANTDGGINSTVSVNNTAGFSIVQYGTGTGSATTVGHGLNAKPNFIIVKPLGNVDTGGWILGGDNIDSTYNNVLELNSSAASANDPSFNDTAPTSSVFSVGNNNTNRSGETYIAYCFVSIKGYSKFGSYIGNGNADGTFVYTGFKPAFVLTKEIPNSSSWDMHDNKRDTHNVCNKYLLAEDTGGEGTTDILDFLSNGFKFRTTNGDRNQNGQKFIYMAFAESPFVTAGTKAAGTAR